MILPAAYQQLVGAFDQLPAIGPRAAARLAQHLLNHAAEGQNLRSALEHASVVRRCVHCRLYCTGDRCTVCGDETRDSSRWLIVAGIDEVLQAEQAGWRGRYFVLHGLLSPATGIGPKQLGLDQLQQQVRQSGDGVRWVVALDGSAEGRATAVFIRNLIQGEAVTLQCCDWHDWLQQGAS